MVSAKWTRNALLSALFFSPALAQESLCDTYTTALLKDNTAENQYTLLTLLVNTALIGNYTQPNKNAVTGILVPGQYNGKNVTLLPYFNGGFVSTNRANKETSVNFLDDGGAIPLAQNKPANGTNSNQYRLLTHLYQYFGALLGCSKYGSQAFPAYQGNAKMYEVHKYMNLDPNEMGYFIQEVGLAAASFGVSTENVTYVGTYLANTFNQRCSPRQAILPSETPDLQAMCINSACPTATSGAICSSYNKNNGIGIQPATASSTPGPQLSDLAPQLSSIAAGQVKPTPAGAGPVSYITSTIVSTSGSSTITVATSTIPVGGAIVTTGTDVVTSGSSTISSVFTSTIPSSVIEQVTTVITSGSSTVTSTMASTEANPALQSSVQTVETSVITSGSSTITSLITTSVAASGGAAGSNTSTSSKNAAPLQTAAAGMMAIMGAAAVIGQM